MNLTKLKKWFRRVSRGEGEEEAPPTRSRPVKDAPAAVEKPNPPLPKPSPHPKTSPVANPPVRKPHAAKSSSPKPGAGTLSRQGIPILRPDEDLDQHFMGCSEAVEDTPPGGLPAHAAPGGKPGSRSTGRSSSTKAPQALAPRNRAGIPQLDGQRDLREYFLSAAPQATRASQRPPAKGEPGRKGKDSPKPEAVTATDRHGIPRLDDHADLRRFFETAMEGEEDRATAGELGEVFQASLDQDARRLMKKKTGGFFAPRRLTLKEKLRRYPAPQAQLDLHGDTALIARQRADSFLRTAVAEGSLTVRLIVGKGLHSEGGAVLPDVIEDLLVVLKREGRVLTYRWDKGGKRKSGAVIVYLEPPY